ncbi:hypothetical protein H490_0103530 [Leucobacter sp. UCD-THU]|jgi:hypothetical protein|nr:hypothetical protein H490_0103530 [Leucobacter sp. UCD-THU]
MTAPLAAPGSRSARFGLSAFVTVLALWGLMVAAGYGGYLPSGAREALVPIAAGASYIAGVTLAVVLRVRKEPRKPAIITLVLLFAGPLLFFLLVLLVR